MKVKKIIGITLIVLLFSLMAWTRDDHGITVKENSDSVYVQDRLYGEVIGVMPGHVVWHYNPSADEWNGDNSRGEMAHFDQVTILEQFQNNKILIAYYDPKQSLGQLAEIIAEQSGGDLFEIKTTESYSAIYHTPLDQVWQDQKDLIRPEIFSRVDEMEAYDVIFIGYPILWGDLPEVVTLFLEDYDLSGKIIVPFSTYNKGDLEKGFEPLAEVFQELVVVDDFSVDASLAWQSKEKITAWLESLEIANR